MDKDTIRATVAETGRMLLEKKLVARTWGNISARVDAEHFACSPSGLDYLHTEPLDVAIVNIADLEWEGRRKPSSEKGIHAAAYRTFPEVNFVIHTHQDYATALSLGGFDNSLLTEEEKAKLGEVMTAGYGLPGTKKLRENVSGAFELGARVVLMEHHGAVICGKSRDEAFEMANMLEEVCKKQIKGVNPEKSIGEQFAALGVAIPAQLDDMAQMIGAKLPVCENNDAAIKAALAKSGAVTIKGVGIQTYAEDREEQEALQILAEKAAISYMHTKALGCEKKSRLSSFDCLLMRVVYKLKYSKQKKG